MSDVLINDAIPRTMTREGLEYLGRLARLVPKHGLIVEIGPLFGSSTWVLAKNSDPTVKVISIDTWERQPWIERVESEFPGCKQFSKEAFEYYVKDCPNVEARQGMSPAVMEGWNADIDLFFDDATHGDPGFTESLEFYVPKLRPGGIACGDDFASGWPDIVRGVYSLGGRWGASPEVTGRVWALVKPDHSGKSASIYSRTGPYSDMDISISVRTQGGKSELSSPGCWAGRLHGVDPILGLKLDWANPRADGVSGCLQVRDAAGRISRWHSFGEWIEVKDRPISSFRAHLIGAHEPSLGLSYQACAIIAGRRGPYTRNTRAFRDGEWIVPEEEFKSAKAISALRCTIAPVKHTL